MRYTITIFLCLLFISTLSFGQLSSGGFPLQVNALKSAEKQFVRMPILKQSVIDEAMNRNASTDNMLKAFKFAHAFEVDLNPTNSGQWYSTNANYNVWKLTIESKNAKSLNLIFHNFQLPDGVRLYLYNEKLNHYLGAFTSDNNKPSEKFAVAPVAGGEITIQYEVPKAMGTPADFKIARVNHDFIGILKFDRRPFSPTVAGDCNVDVNCDFAVRWNDIKNSVCRLIVDGDEVCSGTLINNTSEDQTPYVISASHCYDKWEYAETSVYTFNYESPYCAPLDGDPMHSLSGSIMKAHFDSLDFALVQLDEIPPPNFRPYYAGWNRLSSLPDSSVSIHHPWGDVKKIALDYDEAAYATFESNSIKNPKNGSFEIKRWDEGVTEKGSSGGGLFDNKENFIGTLSGGAAYCGNPVRDYFARFAMQWDYSSDSTKQLKYWLDPINSGQEILDGKQFNTGENLCKAFTNLTDFDEHTNVGLTVSGEDKGYWGGTNDVGITEIVERFHISGNESLDGIALGIGKLVQSSSASDNEIKIKVYDGDKMPETLIYSKLVNIKGFAEDAMNYIEFDETVEPQDTFFIGFELTNINTQDTFVIYQSLRSEQDLPNSFFYKKNSSWYNFKDTNPQAYSMVNVMELVACNIDNITDTPIVEIPVNVLIYPNPTSSELVLESDNEIDPTSISVYNIIGQELSVYLLNVEPYRVRINLDGKTPGVYFVRFNYDDSYVTRKFSFVPK